MNDGYYDPYYNSWDYLPWDYPGVETRTRAVVQREMEDAVAIEDYERAAVLRDELKGM